MPKYFAAVFASITSVPQKARASASNPQSHHFTPLFRWLSLEQNRGLVDLLEFVYFGLETEGLFCHGFASPVLGWIPLTCHSFQLSSSTLVNCWKAPLVSRLIRQYSFSAADAQIAHHFPQRRNDLRRAHFFVRKNLWGSRVPEICG